MPLSLQGEGALSVSQPPAQAKPAPFPPRQPFLQPFPSGQARPHPRLQQPAQLSPGGETASLLPFIAESCINS